MTTFRWPGPRLEFVISDGKAPPPIPLLPSHWSPSMGNGKHLSLYKSSNSYHTGVLRQTHGNRVSTCSCWNKGTSLVRAYEIGCHLRHLAASFSWHSHGFQHPNHCAQKQTSYCHFQVGLTWATGQSHCILFACNLSGIKDPASET